MEDTSNILKFKAEVSNFGAEACLPTSLSNFWINYLDEELRVLGDAGNVDPDNFHPYCALAAIVTILSNIYSAREVRISHDNLFDKLIEFRIEIGLEIVSRQSNINYEPATLKNIFTNRSVECWNI